MSTPSGFEPEDVAQVNITQDGDATVVVLPPGQSAVYTDESGEHVVASVLVVESTPGPVGPQGEQGPEGAPGPKGQTGDQGPEGRRGEVGPRGLPGGTGKQGPRGPEGVQGKQGRDGPHGRTGDRGLRGETGPQGIPGKQGDTGARGLPGFDGVDGVGIVGPDGRSAFELARAAGFKGTESAWLASLHGERGKQGERGLRGEKGERGDLGPKGEKGEIGHRGPAGGEGRFGSAGPAGAPGAPGPAGPAGADGTPGALWFTGVGSPAGGLGSDGDFYLDSVSGDYYEKVAGVWVLQGNLKGPAGGGSDPSYIALAAEDLAAGDFCYTDAAGQIALAQADAPGNQCTGYVLTAAPAGTPATFYWSGLNTAVVGLAPGDRHYLSDAVAGAATDVPVRGAGKFDQYLGRAITATVFLFEADDLVRLAS